jgi:hypothetical protein
VYDDLPTLERVCHDAVAAEQAPRALLRPVRRERAFPKTPIGIDFVGNSEISSFSQNPPPTPLAGIFIPYQRTKGRGSS